MVECTPGTPGIGEVRPEMGSESFDFCTDQPQVGGGTSKRQVGGGGGTRTVSLRAEIDTSPPFGSVKEAVTRFGGRGSWLPYYKFGDGYQAIEDIDIKKVEEQAAELEKDLIVKELETLDVLEELATTKRIVEELKRQLQNEALRCMTIPDDHRHKPRPGEKEMNKESYVGCLSPYPASSPDSILMELKQAKLNLGKTTDDLGVIQTSVECLHKKMRKEKGFLEKTRQRLTSRFAGVLSLGEELKQARVKPQVDDNLGIEYKNRQLKNLTATEIVEVSRDMSHNGLIKTDLRTAELRLLAARKMEEAARAAEAVALAEIKALSSNEKPSVYILPEPEKVALFQPQSPLTPKAQKTEVALKKKAEVNISKMSIMKKLRDAREEVKLSKQALEEALNKVEMANRKQFATEESLRKWMPEDDDRVRPESNYPTGISKFHIHLQPDHSGNSPLNDMTRASNPHIEDPKPVLRSTVSARDVMSRQQQVLPEEYAAARPTEHRGGRRKVALSQMLHELREDLTFHPRAEKVGESGDQKQLFTQRRKFGFIHIALPMTKPSKKKVQDFNSVMN